MPKSTDIKRILIAGGSVNRVMHNGDVIWVTTDAPDFLITNVRTFYANAGGNQYLSARGYSQVAIGSWASDYAYLIGDLEYSYRGNTFTLAEGVQLDVTSVGTSWLTVRTVGGRGVVVAEHRGTTAGAARVGTITGASIEAEIDGVSKTLTWGGSISVTQQANAIEATYHRDPHATDAFTITSSAFDYPTHAKCPANTEDGPYAVITASGIRTTTRNTEYWYTSGAIDHTTTTVTQNIPLGNIEFDLTWHMENPFDWAELYPYRGALDPDEQLPWEYDDGTTYAANQRIVTFKDMGTDEYPDGRAVDVYVNAVDENGDPVAFRGGNTIRLYQAANVASSPTYLNPVGTFSLGIWEASGTDVAVAEGEDEPVDTAVLTTDITVTKRVTYSSGAWQDTMVSPSFHDNTLRLIIPASSSWVSQSENSSDRDKKRNVHVAANGNTTTRTGYPSLFVMFPGQTAVIMGTIAIRQAAYDDGGEEPEPEDE